MAYDRVNWQTGIAGETPVSAGNLNVMDAGIKAAHDAIDAIAGGTLTYSWTDNLGPGEPVTFDFVLPEGSTTVTQARLIVRGKAATDITSAIAAASGSTGTESGHTHTLDITGGWNTQTAEPDSHSHAYWMAGTNGVNSGGAHNHSLGSHVHSVTKAISKGTTPTGVAVKINNGSGFGSNVATGDDPVLIDADLSAAITATDDIKQIQVSGTRLGRVDVLLLITTT